MRIRDALNYKQLEDLRDLSYELRIVLNERIKLFQKTCKKARKLIAAVLGNNPKFRKRFTSSQKLSNEVKFMYKDIPSVFQDRFPDQCASQDGKNILNSKIVSLFFLQLSEFLKEPYQLKKLCLEEYNKSFEKTGVAFSEFIDLLKQCKACRRRFRKTRREKCRVYIS